MADRSLIVRILGDASSLKNTYNEAIRATKQFGNVQQQEVEREEKNLVRLKSKRAQSLGPLRLAAAGLGGGAAIFAGIQGLRALADGLKTVGDEAFTTEGRIKNFAAALVSGDIAAGLQALTSQESRIAPDLEKAVAALRQMRDEASRISLQEVIGQTDTFDEKLLQTQRDMVSIGIPIDQVKEKTLAWRRELEKAAVTTVDLGAVFKSVFAGIETVLGNATRAAEKAFREAAAARQKMLTGLATLPPGIGAAIARESGVEGSEANLLKVLRAAAANLDKRIDDLRKKKGAGVSEALRSAQQEQNQINAQIDAILAARAVAAEKQQALAEEAARKAKAAGESASRARQAAREAQLQFLREQAADAAARKRVLAAQRQARQFRALGLSAEGDKPIPTISNLTKQLNQLDTKVAGGKNQRLLNAIRKVLTNPVEKATVETRAKIKELFDTIRQGFEEGTGSGPLTKTSGLNTKKILEGLGLDAVTEAEIRSRLSSFNSAGRALAPPSSQSTAAAKFGAAGIAGGVVVESHVTLKVGEDVLAKVVTRGQQKAGRRNPRQKRGPNRIGGV